MKRAFVGCLVLTLGLTFQAVAQPPNWNIACQGTESGGGGQRQYEYDLRNVTAGPLNLTDLLVTTNDMGWGHYSNWVMPQGWNVALVPVGGWTNLFKTPHGQVAPPPQQLGAGWIHWSAPANQPLNVPANQTVLFGFDNQFPSWNVDWYALPEQQHQIGANWNSAVAGPLGVYTDGPVHAPYVPEPSTLLIWSLLGVLGITVGWWRARHKGA